MQLPTFNLWVLPLAFTSFFITLANPLAQGSAERIESHRPSDKVSVLHRRDDEWYGDGDWPEPPPPPQCPSGKKPLCCYGISVPSLPGVRGTCTSYSIYKKEWCQKGNIFCCKSFSPSAFERKWGNGVGCDGDGQEATAPEQDVYQSPEEKKSTGQQSNGNVWNSISDWFGGLGKPSAKKTPGFCQIRSKDGKCQ